MRKPLHDLLIDMASVMAEERFEIAREALRYHGGLGAMMQKNFGRNLEPYEMQSILWEALLLAPDEYDPKKGAATTLLKKICRRLTEREVYARCTIGSVRVPLKSKHRYKKELIEFFADSPMLSNEPDGY
jgi:hypothetical protein